MQIENPEIVYLPCFAHQVNLCMGEIFKESSVYAETAKQAAFIAKYFQSQNNIYFIGKLREIQMVTYNKLYALIAPGDTRWNSYYYCFSSLLRTKEAIKVLMALLLFVLIFNKS